MELRKWSVSFELDGEKDESYIVRALEAVGATRILIYPEKPSSARPMHHGYPE